MKKTVVTSLAVLALSVSGMKAQSLTWAKNMGGLGKINYGYSIAVDANGNSYTTGYFAGSADFDPGPGTFSLTSAGGDDIFILKLNSAGNFVWAKRMGGTAIEHGLGIALDSKQNVYLTGTFQGTVDFDPGAASYSMTSAGGDDDFICKLDSAGNFRWARRVGNANVDGAAAIATDPSYNVLVTGFFRQLVDFDPGAGTSNLTTMGFEDCFVLKLDSTGAFVWVKQIGGGSSDFGYALTSDASGNVYTTGTYGATLDLDPGAGTSNVTSVGGSDIFISKLSTSGAFIWGGSMGGSNIDAGNAITVDAQGNMYTTGFFWGNGDFDPGAGTYSLTAIGDKDIFVSKLNSTGGLVWVKAMGGTNIDVGSSIVLDGTGNVYTSGFFHSQPADFDPGVGAVTYTPVWGADMYVSCLDMNGNYVSSKVIGGAVDDGVAAIGMDASGNIYATGDFGGVVDFDPGPATVNLSSSGATDIFVMKLGPVVVGMKETAESRGELLLFPNPSAAHNQIFFSNAGSEAEVHVFNMNGQLVRSLICAGSFTVENLNQGLYIVRVKEKDKAWRSAKLIISK